LPKAAIPAALPRDFRLQIVSTSNGAVPEGDIWLHEIKHNGFRMAAIFDGRGGIKLISRQGLDRTSTFRDVFHGFAASGPMILDGEIAAPDENGVTHIDGLHQAIAARRPDRLAYFAFDLIHLAGRDLRACGIEERKAVLRDAIGSAGCERVVYLDHVIGRGAELFDKVAALGGEGIVSKRLGRPYRGGETRDWLKTKVFEIGRFAVIGFQELGERRLEALYVAEERDGALCPAGQVRFGFAGRGLWAGLDGRRAGAVMKGIVPSIRSCRHRSSSSAGTRRGLSALVC
jgi:bifunctional non-homologous end joining protein LigD